MPHPAIRSLALQVTALAVVLASSLVGGSAADASATTPCTGAAPAPSSAVSVAFTSRASYDATPVVEAMRAAVCAAAKGASIDVASYIVAPSDSQAKKVIDALAYKKAQDGVTVHWLVETTTNGTTTTSASALKTTFGEGNVTSCSAGCLDMGATAPDEGSVAHAHSKMLTVSSTSWGSVPGANDTSVVVMGSANWSDRQLQEYWQDALTVVGNKALYQGQVAAYDRMVTCEEGATQCAGLASTTPGWTSSGDLYGFEPTAPRTGELAFDGDSGSGTSFQFFPALPATEGGSVRDDAADLLSSVTGCGADGRIDVAMYLSSPSRAKKIGAQLARLQSAGCKVRLLVGRGTATPTPADAISAYTGAGLAPQCVLLMHLKFTVLHDVTIGGDQGQTLIMDGSQNWSTSGLVANDENEVVLSTRGATSSSAAAITALAARYSTQWDAVQTAIKDSTVQSTAKGAAAGDCGTFDDTQLETFHGTAKVGLSTTSPKVGAPVTATVSLAGVTPTAKVTVSWVRTTTSGTSTTVGSATTYTPTASDVGTTLTAKATLTRNGFESRPLAPVTVGKVAPGAAPHSTAAPAVSGTAKVGQTLAANSGTWSAPKGATLSFAYQWLADGSAINGATSSKLILPVTVVGKSVSVRVTASAAGYTSATVPSKTTVKVLAGSASKASKVPVVTGTVAVGHKVTASSGSWDASGLRLSYQWLRSGVAVKGATASSYTLTASDYGKFVAVRVSAARTGYSTGTSTSASHKVAAGSAAKATKVPKVTGTVGVGHKLTGSRGTWNASGLSYSYQWLRSGAVIKGATGSTHTVTTADVGKKLSLRVTARRTGYASGTSTSGSTKAVPRSKASVTVKLAHTSVKHTARDKVTVHVKVAGVSRPTGTVRVTYGSHSVKVTVKSSGKGTVTVSLPKLKKGTYKVHATFSPSGSTAHYGTSGTSKTVKLHST